MNMRTWFVVGAAAVVFAGSVAGLAVAAAGPPDPDPSQAKLDVNVSAVPEVMTAVYKAYGGSYSNRWVARTIITNTGDVPVRNFQITYKIPGYCGTTSVEDYPLILPGQTVRDYCWPNFDPDKMAQIDSKTPAEVMVSYTYDGLEHPRQTSEKFAFLGHNDFIHTYLPDADCLTFADFHDNADLLAAMVTSRKEDIQKLAKRINGGFSTGTDDGAMEALGRIYDTLRDWPLEYVSEPLTFWSREFAQHIQFPSETIASEGGNCVDLSLLFSAMLGSVGVKTYLLLSQGHCQFAIELPESGDIIPVEETLVGTTASLQDSMDMACSGPEPSLPSGRGGALEGGPGAALESGPGPSAAGPSAGARGGEGGAPDAAGAGGGADAGAVAAGAASGAADAAGPEKPAPPGGGPEPGAAATTLHQASPTEQAAGEIYEPVQATLIQAHFCRHCGAPLPQADSNFCPTCGGQLG